MRRTCDHPGCVGVAAVAFAFDGASRVVRINVTDTPGAAGLLCSRHAARFQPPHGWQMIDDRPAAPDEQLAFEAAPATEPIETTSPAPAAAPVPVPAPVPGASDASPDEGDVGDDDFDDLLNADSPLLARAFRTAL